MKIRNTSSTGITESGAGSNTAERFLKEDSYTSDVRNSSVTHTGSAGRIARFLVCLMLSLALVFPMSVPAEVFAVNESTSTTASAASAASSYTTAQTQSLAGIDIVFSEPVISNRYLKSGPTLLNAKGRRSSIKLSWKAVVKPSAIKGYIIVRRDKTGNTWRQIATVDRNTTTFVDKTATTKNRLWSYSVLAYKIKAGKVMVSGPAGWAGAATTRSNKKNVYDLTVSNPANATIVMEGSCAQTYLKFPKKPYSRYIRWWSGDDSIATVDSKGLITGVSAGETLIYVKSHTGTISTFNVKVSVPGTAQAMVDTFYAWEGYSRFNGKHKGIIDIYNSITPWPAGYKMKYTDAWCDATVSAAAIKTGTAKLIGRECSVPRHINIFKRLGIWEEDGTITPKPGDIIVYSWRKFRQPNNSSGSHIGIVAKVEGKTITAIEGNRGIGEVSTRTIPVGWGCIRGYARPKYKKATN